MHPVAFKSELIDRVLFTRWLAPPSADDVRVLESRLLDATRQLRKPLIYVGALDPGMKMPNAQERQNLNQLMNVARKYCEAAHLILEGSHLQVSLLRVIVSGMLIVTRSYDDFLAVHESADPISQDLSQRLRRDGGHYIRQARARGLVAA